MTEHYYQSIQGYFDWEHVYRDAVAWMPEGGTFVEVGCWKGMSLAFVLVEAKNSGKRFNVFGVDHFLGSVGDGPLIEMAARSDIAAACGANLTRAGYPVKLIVSKSWEGADCFPDRSCDYVFIDASHDKESVMRDFKAWLPKVKPGGYLAGHDIGQAPVEQAVRESVPDAVWKTLEVLPRSADEGGPTWGTAFRMRV